MKKLAKGLALVLSLALILSLCACGGKDSQVSETPEKSLYDQGLEIISVMDEMVHSEEYIQVYTASEDIMNVVNDIARGDFSTPSTVYAITASRDTVSSLLSDLAKLDSLENASQALQNTLRQKALGTIMTQINSMSGVNNLAATSVCTVGKTFVCSDAAQDVIYLYTYDNAVPVAVTFIVGEGGAVSGTGTFILFEDFSVDSLEEVKEFFSELGVEVTEVTE